ncbi:MAG: Crp/Fnr family transcriptional regulator [Pyrinomonadaceae bacterium]
MKVSHRHNSLLRALPAKDIKCLLPHLKVVPLKPDEVIYDSEAVVTRIYFPVSGVISLVKATAKGSTVEVGVVGNEGMVGTPVLLGGRKSLYQAVVQSTGEAFVIDAKRMIGEFENCGKLQSILHRYLLGWLTQVTQSVVCNRFHTAEKRFCRWLLMIHDRVGADEFALTQKTIARMLGIRRAGVSEISSKLMRKGLIRYSRGRMTILDRKLVEETSCECYQLFQFK